MLTREDSEKLQTHLKAIGLKACPECGNTGFVCAGPLALSVWSPLAISPDGNTDAMLVVKVVCGNCFAAREFAWQPIVSPAREEAEPSIRLVS